MPSQRVQTYAMAFAIGVAAMLAVLPLPVLWGGGPGWLVPMGDQAQHAAGHLAYQADDWRWPLLFTTRVASPQGISISLTDSNPLMSLTAKLWTHATGAAPANWLGGFLGACWVMQAVAAAYAARGLRVSPSAAIAAAGLACAWPALIARQGHINLCAHALLLVALGLVFRRVVTGIGPIGPRFWLIALLLLIAAVLTHPYLFQLCAAVLAAIPLHAALRRKPDWWREVAAYVVCGVLAIGVLRLLAGPLGGGDKGFVFFSMNLLAPVWPQRSGVFGPELPIIDATGGQYEGFNWLGAGTMLLLLAAVGAAVWRRALPRPPAAVVTVLAGLALLSLSSRVYAGSYKLLDLGVKPWEDLFGTFRTPGRAFWPVGYAIMLAGVAAADRLPKRLAAAVLIAAVVLQWIDTRPLVQSSRSIWEAGLGTRVPPVPIETALFGMAPHPGCTRVYAAMAGGPVMILDAVRMGARSTVIGSGRPPKWFSCGAVIADALELPLLQGESRAFFETALTRPANTALLGPDTDCRRSETVVVCSRGTAAPTGEAVAMSPAPGLFGSGWGPMRDGALWSDGSPATLLLPPTVHSVRLRLTAIADRSGQDRVVTVAVGRGPAISHTLKDGAETTLVIPIPPGVAPRIALAMRTIDPARRGFDVPAHRVGIRLLDLSMTDEAGRAVDTDPQFPPQPKSR